MKCKACGDIYDNTARHLEEERYGIVASRAEWVYCRECANELFRGVINTAPAKTFPSGSGCPMEDGRRDDPSPWEENNIRIMEGN